MFCLNRNENIACENCGTETTKWNIARHKKRCSVGTILLQATSDFSKTSQTDLNYLEKQKKQPSVRANNTYNVKFVWRKFCPLSATKTLLESAWNFKNEIQTWYGYSSRKYVCDRKKKESIFCSHFLVDFEFEKMDTTHLFSSCDLWSTPSSTRNLIKCSAFQKSSQFLPWFQTCSGKHRNWNVWIILCRRKQCGNGEV